MISARTRLRLGLLTRVAAASVMLATVPAATFVTTAQAAVVSGISVEGNERVDDETIRAYLVVQPGRTFSAEDVDESLRALFETGLFSDVRIVQRGGTLVVTVDENPVINQIAFEGNSKYKDAQLSEVIQSKERNVFTRAKVQSDVQRILELYRRTGRFQASVEPKIIELPENRINLVYEVSEGPKTSVSRISFIGNQAYGDSKLRNLLATRQSNILSFLRGGDTYDPDRITADEEKIRRFYQSRGYADFAVVSSVADLDRERNSFFITFTIDEGERYSIGSVEVDSIVPGVDPSALRRLVQTDPGDEYSSVDIEQSLEAITLELAGQGYPFAQARPRIERNAEARTVDIVYVVDEGPRAYIERINVVGNTRTRDYVIRREFDIAEGDAFNRVLIDRAERRLTNLGYFKTVKITTEPGSSEDRIVVNVAVEEQPTGELSFGAGYVTTSGIVGDISLTERNFLGRGYIVRGAVSGGTDTRNFELAFTDPYFLGRRISAGVNVFSRTIEEDEDRAYAQETIGGGVTFGFPITEDFGVQVGYQIERQNIDIPGYSFEADLADGDRTKPGDGNDFDCVLGVSRAYCEAEGETYVSSVLYSLIYDTVDSKTDPSDGIYARFTQQFAGVGGDVSFLRTTAEATAFRELYTDYGLVGVAKVQGGHITGLNGEGVRLVDAFYKGGETVRGFEGAGFGPRDLIRNSRGRIIGEDAVGGNLFVAGTAEVQFPLPIIPSELGLKGALFADAGTLWRTEDAIDDLTRLGVERQDSLTDMSIRSSVGASILWASPLGPIRADFAYVLTKEEYDETQFFRIGGGTRF